MGRMGFDEFARAVIDGEENRAQAQVGQFPNQFFRSILVCKTNVVSPIGWEMSENKLLSALFCPSI